MVSSVFKKQFEAITRNIVSPLARLGVTPNHITVIGLIAAIISTYFYAEWNGNRIYIIFAALMVLLSGLLDAIDGVLARNTGKVTHFGGFFDSVMDRYSDALVISGIIIGGLCSVPAGLVAIVGSMMVSYTRSRAEMEGIKMAGVGFFERAERIIFLILCSIASYWWLQALEYGVIILAALAHVTLIQRVMYFKKEIEKN